MAAAPVLAVAHRRFLDLPASAYLQKIVRHGCLIDVKSVFDPAPFREEGLRVWRRYRRRGPPLSRSHAAGHRPTTSIPRVPQGAASPDPATQPQHPCAGLSGALL